MARTSTQKHNVTIHPYRFKFIGVLLSAAALYLAVALVSYYSGDPSLNHSTGNSVQNLGGETGAIAADLLLQTTGAASLLLIITLLAWGWRMTSENRSIKHLPLRISCLLFAICALSVLLNLIETPSFWPIASGLGGAIAVLLHQQAASLAPNWLIGLAAAIITCITAPIALGLNRDEWGSIYSLFQRGWGWLLAGGGLVYTGIKSGSDLAAPLLELRQKESLSSHQQSRASAKNKAREKMSLGTRAEKTQIAEKAQKKKESSKVSRNARATEKKQASLQLPTIHGDYELPSYDILKPPPKNNPSRLSDASLKQNAMLLESVLEDFGVSGEIINIRPGPVVTLYELEPAAGTKSSRVIGLADDIARSMSAISARISVIPGRNAIGIELPNQQRETVYMREILEDEVFGKTQASLPLVLGKDIGGDPVVTDLARMPHLLVAGTTGSGKSVAINTMIASLLYHYSPEQCKFIMVDPKMLELSVYDGIPHLLSPVVTDPGKAVVALNWAVKEMENRYRLMANLGVRNIANYNKKLKEAVKQGKTLTRNVQTGFDVETGKPIFEEQEIDTNPLPYIVVIVDEMADLMLVAGKDIEGSIQRLAQMARAAGIHLIMATQRPSVDVITGVIKANFPTRISFQVTSKIDSRTILGEMGAEQLLGMGDMLYMAGGSRLTRVHGPFISDKEVDDLVQHLKAQGEPQYIEAVTVSDEPEEGAFGDEEESDADRELYDRAVAVVARDRKASTSYIQRSLKIGYNRAATLIEKMERNGIVGAANHVGKREILLPEED